MGWGKKARGALLGAAYLAALAFFYVKYVPLIPAFQACLVPALAAVFFLTLLRPPWGLALFVGIVPLINNLPYFFGITEDVPHAPTALVLFLFFFGGWLIRDRLIAPVPRARAAILRPLAGFALIVALSAVITALRYLHFPPLGSDGVYELVTNVNGVTSGGAVMSVLFHALNYLSGIAFFWIWLRTVRDFSGAVRILNVFLLSTLVSIGFGLFQVMSDRTLGNNPYSIQQSLVNATLKDAMSLAAFLAMAAPLFLCYALAARKAVPAAGAALAVLGCGLIVETGSRSGLLAIAAAMLFAAAGGAGLFWKRARSWPPGKRRTVFSAAGLGLAVFLAAGILGKGRLVRWAGRSPTAVRFGQIETNIVQFRLSSLWKMAVEMARDFPVTGVGVGSFIIEVPNYYQAHKMVFPTDTAENIVLQVGSEMGVIGLGFLLWIAASIVLEMGRGWKRTRGDPPRRFIYLGCLSALLAYGIIAQSHTYMGSFEVKYVAWLMVGLIFTLGGPSREPSAETVISILRPSILIVAAAAVFAVVHLWNSTHGLSLSRLSGEFGVKPDFGFFQAEKTADGRDFRWARETAGLELTETKGVVRIPVHASHPDIQENPVRLRIYLFQGYFKKTFLLGDVLLDDRGWKTLEYALPPSVAGDGRALLVFKVSRTWVPLKASATPDPRRLGVAVGTIGFSR
ncbi:MAG: hypothetical protein FJY82_00870 [Candidatus Aminicenantes bacterium]|nr:hypothetical protein [Candidatus Aminicenantes bacterium]